LADEPVRDEHERHDEESADHSRNAEAANGPPAILGEENAADDCREPDDEGAA